MLFLVRIEKYMCAFYLMKTHRKYHKFAKQNGQKDTLHNFTDVFRYM